MKRATFRVAEVQRWTLALPRSPLFVLAFGEFPPPGGVIGDQTSIRHRREPFHQFVAGAEQLVLRAWPAIRIHPSVVDVTPFWNRSCKHPPVAPFPGC